MTVDGVKAITIPEGTVKKIEWGGRVLWEKPEDPASGPVVTVAYENRRSLGVYWETFCTITIAGLSGAQIQKVSANFQSYQADSGQWVSVAPLRGHTLTETGENCWEDRCSYTLGINSVVTKGWNTPRILAELTYTGPEGDTRVCTAAVAWTSPWA